MSQFYNSNRQNSGNGRRNAGGAAGNRGNARANRRPPFDHNAYLDSDASDWLLSTPRKIQVTYECKKCAEENFEQRLEVTDNGDGTWTQHTLFCSKDCMMFNKNQAFFAYQFFRGASLYEPMLEERFEGQTIFGKDNVNIDFTQHLIHYFFVQVAEDIEKVDSRVSNLYTNYFSFHYRNRKAHQQQQLKRRSVNSSVLETSKGWFFSHS
jgi:hypothetical protein